MNSYEQRQEARRERLERAAERADREASTAFERAGSLLPDNGQPVLIGHHSEKRHRRALARADNLMRKACEQTRNAADLTARAAAVGSGGISADDPDAVTKLTEKRTHVAELHTKAKALNAWWRKHKTMQGAPGISDETAARLDADIPTRYTWERQPFPAYRLALWNKEIKRIDARIAELSAPPREYEPQTFGPVVVEADTEANRVCVRFARELATDTARTLLKSRGFRWNRGLTAWTRQLNPGAWWVACQVAEMIGQPT